MGSKLGPTYACLFVGLPTFTLDTGTNSLFVPFGPNELFKYLKTAGIDLGLGKQRRKFQFFE